MTFNEAFMKKALKRVNELQQEMIEKSKKVPNSEALVKGSDGGFLSDLWSVESFSLGG